VSRGVQDDADFELCEHFPTPRVIRPVPLLGYGAARGHHAQARLALRQCLQRCDLLPEPSVFRAEPVRVLGIIIESGLAVLAQSRTRDLKLRDLGRVPGARIVDFPHDLPGPVTGQEPFAHQRVRCRDRYSRRRLALRGGTDSAYPRGAPIGVPVVAAPRDVQPRSAVPAKRRPRQQPQALRRSLAIAFRRGRLHQRVMGRAVPQRLRQPHRPPVSPEDGPPAVHEIPQRRLTAQNVLEGMPGPRPALHRTAIQLGPPISRRRNPLPRQAHGLCPDRDLSCLIGQDPPRHLPDNLRADRIQRHMIDLRHRGKPDEHVAVRGTLLGLTGLPCPDRLVAVALLDRAQLHLRPPRLGQPLVFLIRVAEIPHPCVIGRDHNPVLAGQQRLGVQRVPHVAADPVDGRGHDPVIRSHLTAQPRAQALAGHRVGGPRYLPVIGPRDDVAPGVGRRLQVLVALALRAAGLVGLPAQTADCHQAASATVILGGEHIFHDACSGLHVWITEASRRL
jgi:hypothetical protein